MQVDVNKKISILDLQDDINGRMNHYFLTLLMDNGYNVYSRDGVFIASFVYLDDVIDFLRAKGEDYTYIENVLSREVFK